MSNLGVGRADRLCLRVCAKHRVADCFARRSVRYKGFTPVSPVLRSRQTWKDCPDPRAKAGSVCHENRLMERLRRTVVQLEEAKRFILNGEVARLRLAVILLDNAVEVILHRRVNDTLQSANMYARMLHRFPDRQLDAKGEALRQEIAAKTTRKRARRRLGDSSPRN
jgi:hypothetical protein